MCIPLTNPSFYAATSRRKTLGRLPAAVVTRVEPASDIHHKQKAHHMAEIRQDLDGTWKIDTTSEWAAISQQLDEKNQAAKAEAERAQQWSATHHMTTEGLIA